MVFQDKINVSPAVQFTVTVTRRLIVKTDGIYKYVNSDESCICDKHVRAQNKGSHVGKKLRSRLIHTFEADSYINHINMT